MKHPNWSRIALHVLFWIVYLPINAVLSCILRGAHIEEEFGMALIGEAFSLPVKLVFTYFVFYYVIPLFLERSKIWQLIGLLLVAFMVATLLYRLEIAWVFFPIFAPDVSIEIFYFKGILLTLFDLFITLAAAGTVKMIRMHYKSLEFEQQLIREKLQSELNFLRAQTNPHFLFNTLNNIYAAATLQHPRTADMVLRLSDLLRYVTYDGQAAQVPLEKEIAQIHAYLELFQLKSEHPLNIRFQVENTAEGRLIEPVLLLPLVENALKHGDLDTRPDAFLNINLQNASNRLLFRIENSFDPENRQKDETGGVGLNNVRQRLELNYPRRHRFEAGVREGTFVVDLLIC